MNRLMFILWILATTTWGLHAQNSGTIRGRVEHNGSPVAYAQVAIKNAGKGTFTDTLGAFVLTGIPFGDHQVSVSLIGFAPQTARTRLSAAAPTAELQLELTENTASLGEVVVSGALKPVQKLESPIPVEVYAQKFFRANPTPSLFESLQNVNGVRPQLNCNVCNTGDIHINGLEGPYTMVLIDGMPIVSGLSTVYGLTGIPQALVDRMEVVKGPASTLYGSEAVGGLINVITKSAESAPRFAADVFSTSWAEVNADLGARFTAGKNAHSLLGIHYFNYQNPIDNNSDGFTDVTLQHRISVFNKWRINRADGKGLSVAARYLYEDRWGGQMNWTPAYRGGDSIYGESIYTNRWELFGVYQLPVEEEINLSFSANGHDQNSVYGNTVYLGTQYIGFGQLTWRKQLGSRHDLLSGLAYRYTWYDDNTPATATVQGQNKPSVIHLPGVFIQDEIRLHPTRHTLLAGLRGDYNSLHGAILSPRVNYKWSTDDRSAVLRIGAGNGFRVANVFTEDHAALSGARQVVFAGELRPETSWNVNVNYVKQILGVPHAIGTLDATAFYTYFTNRILPDYTTDPNKIIYDNLDGFSVSRGVSLNSDWAFTNGLRLMTGMTLQDVFAEDNGVRMDQLLTESFSAVWNIGYTIPGIKLKIDYTGNLYGPMALPLLGPLDERPAYSPWWSIQNVQVSKVLPGGFEVYGGIKNLLNYTPPANSIARPFDPFDRQVVFDDQGQVVPTPDNPQALTFDPTYVFAPNQGIRGFIGLRYTVP
ncbi:MAG: TonB-dependent receptor [Saprospiraceae bacterium]|nr:TonB-dependent receptor [Saprospiraceae bacterium]